MKLKIQTKLLLYILGVTILIFVLSSGYINYTSRVLSLKSAEKYVLAISEKNALNIERNLSEKLYTARTLSQVFSRFDKLPKSQWQSMFGEMMSEVLIKNPHIFALSAS